MIQVPTYPLHVSELMLVMSAASLETPFKHLAGLYMFRGLCHQHTVQGPDRSIGGHAYKGHQLYAIKSIS
ncbi:hypothetical protein VNO77_43909 [Canavalia gladiata]|uniref:Uncharacterized protein n=1 Tax=Canavalia gladiata TaxID=3824 RepID=A0AAN9JV32_CANGL